MFQQLTITTAGDSQPHRKSVVDDMDPFSSTSFGEVPPSACSTFSEEPTAAPTEDQQLPTAVEAADGTWTSSSLFDNAAATTTVTVDSKDMAFMLTESSDVLAADSADTGLSTQRDDDDSKQEMNGEERAAAAGTWQQFDDDDEVRRETHIFSMIPSSISQPFSPC